MREKNQRNKLIDLMFPPYQARVAFFVQESWDLDSNAAEDLVEKQAEAFKAKKKQLVDRWQKKLPAVERKIVRKKNRPPCLTCWEKWWKRTTPDG